MRVLKHTHPNGPCHLRLLSEVCFNTLWFFSPQKEFHPTGRPFAILLCWPSPRYSLHIKKNPGVFSSRVLEVCELLLLGATDSFSDPVIPCNTFAAGKGTWPGLCQGLYGMHAVKSVCVHHVAIITYLVIVVNHWIFVASYLWLTTKMVCLVAGLGFEPRIAKAYETSPVTGPFPRYFIYV